MLHLRDTGESVATVADDKAACRSAGLRPGNDRMGRKAGGLNPTYRDDGVSDEAATIVHVENERDVLPTAVKQLAGESGCGCRIVYSTWDVEMALLACLRVACRPGSGSQDSEDTVDWGCDGHGGGLRKTVWTNDIGLIAQ